MVWALTPLPPDAPPPQFGDVADARLVRDSFTHRPTGCGWVRFRDAECAAAVVKRCNVTALYIVGARARSAATMQPCVACSRLARARSAGSPRPVRLGATLAEVMLDCWAAPAPGAPQDELRAAAASRGLAEGAPCAGRPRYELVAESYALKVRSAQPSIRGPLLDTRTARAAGVV